MRPRKIVLLITDTIAREEELRFSLQQVQSYRVISLMGRMGHTPDAALVVQSTFGEAADAYMEVVIDTVRKMYDAPVLYLKETHEIAETQIPVECFLNKSASKEDMLYRLKIFTTRKRGPRKARKAA